MSISAQGGEPRRPFVVTVGKKPPAGGAAPEPPGEAEPDTGGTGTPGSRTDGDGTPTSASGPDRAASPGAGTGSADDDAPARPADSDAPDDDSDGEAPAGSDPVTEAGPAAAHTAPADATPPADDETGPVAEADGQPAADDEAGAADGDGEAGDARDSGSAKTGSPKAGKTPAGTTRPGKGPGTGKASDAKGKPGTAKDRPAKGGGKKSATSRGGTAKGGASKGGTAKGGPNRPAAQRRPVVLVKVNQPRRWGPIALVSTVSVLALAIVAYGAYAVYEDSRTWQDRASDIGGLVNYRKSNPSMLTGQNQSGTITYQVSPPAGGNFSPTWQRCLGDVYSAQVPNENAVHSLANGAIWITYRPDLPKDQVEKLASKVTGNDFMLMSPYPGLDKPISLQAWGYQLKVDKASDGRIDDFISTLRQNASVEQDAVCSAGNYTTGTGTVPRDLTDQTTG